jgi:hypothetical protein
MEQCKLCLQSVPSLRDSHFLSSGIYRILRDDNEKNPNPWVLSRKAAVQFATDESTFAVCGLRAAFFQARRELGSKELSPKRWDIPAELHLVRENPRHIVATESDQDLLRFGNS